MDGVRCRFGASNPTVGTYRSAAVVQCVSPPLSTTQHSVEVSLNAGEVFTYNSMPFTSFAVQAVQPWGGPIGERTAVVCTIAGLSNAAVPRPNGNRTHCLFGSPADAASDDGVITSGTLLVDASAMRCLAPPQVPLGGGASGQVLVEVSVEAGRDWTINRLAFQFYNPPTVTSVAPDHTSADGDGVVVARLAGGGGADITRHVLTAQGQNTLRCRFSGVGGAAAGSSVVSGVGAGTAAEGGAAVRCKTPALGLPGSYHVEVTRHGQQLVVLQRTFLLA